MTSLLVLAACAPTQFVVPLEKGEQAVNASFGGPVLNVPGIATIPIPFTSIGYGYGLNTKNTISGTLYPTASLFGVFQMSGQIMHEFWSKGPMNITGKAGFDYYVDVFEKNQRFYPQLDGNFSYTYQKKSTDVYEKRKLVYFGVSNWMILSNTKANNEKQTDHFIFNPHIGHQMKKNRWAFHFELAFLAPNVSNQKIITDYFSLFGKRGATGIYLGLQYHFK